MLTLVQFHYVFVKRRQSSNLQGITWINATEWNEYQFCSMCTRIYIELMKYSIIVDRMLNGTIVNDSAFLVCALMKR